MFVLQARHEHGVSACHESIVSAAGSLAPRDEGRNVSSSTSAVAFQRLLLEVFQKGLVTHMTSMKHVVPLLPSMAAFSCA